MPPLAQWLAHTCAYAAATDQALLDSVDLPLDPSSWTATHTLLWLASISCRTHLPLITVRAIVYFLAQSPKVAPAKLFGLLHDDDSRAFLQAKLDELQQRQQQRQQQQRQQQRQAGSIARLILLSITTRATYAYRHGRRRVVEAMLAATTATTPSMHYLHHKFEDPLGTLASFGVFLDRAAEMRNHVAMLQSSGSGKVLLRRCQCG